MKRLFLAIYFFVSIYTLGQNNIIFFSSAPPDYIPYGKPFELFTTIKFPDTGYDEVNLYIISGNRFTVQDVSIYNSYHLHKVKAADTDYGDYTQAYKITLSKKDSLFDFNNVFRVKYSVAQIYSDNIQIHYALEYLYKNKVIETVTSFGRNQPLSPSSISFYKPQQIAGRCLVMQEGGRLALTVPPLGSQANPLAEFWVKANNVNSDFMQIQNGETNDTYFSLGVNENSFVYLKDFSRVYYTGLSLGKNSWNHFAVYIANGKILVYCNSKCIYENNFSKRIKDEELKYSFFNESSDSYLFLKQLRLWNYQDDIEKCLSNKQYSFFSTLKSELLYQNSFNEEIYAEENSSVKATDLNRLRIVQSDAPLISRAPEVNITVFSNSCSIEWSNKDNQRPKNFIVEKSINGAGFIEVFKTTADEDMNKVYYYSDKRDAAENVTYYRVRQINYDVSEVYSASLKVGQSAKKEKVKLGQNYPNPFNPSTSFTVEMVETGDAVVCVYDLVGKVIKTIYEGTLAKGVHTFNFDGSSLPSGMYLYEIKTPASSSVKKMILTK
jgi:hypothetical protein